MKTIEKVVLKFDRNKDIYFIDNKEVNKDIWILAKSSLESAQSYNHIKRYVDKYGFTSHDYHIENDSILVWEFTTVK